MMKSIHVLERNNVLLFPLLLVSYEMTTYLSNDMYLPALPMIMHDLGLTLKQAQLTLTTWFLGQASMPLMIGILSDRYGRRPILLFGGIIYILATALCATTNHIHLFLLGRFMEGAMVASMLVPGYACIHELFEQKEAVRKLALMGSIVVLAPALGPLFGSLILYFATWRDIFWTIMALGIICILLLMKWMPETHPSALRQPIYLSRLYKEYRAVLVNKKFLLRMFILGFIFAGWLAWITAGPLLIIGTFHFSAIAFGLIQAILFSAFIIGTRCVKYFLDRWGLEKLIALGLTIALFSGLLQICFAFFFPQAIYLFLSAMLFYSFGSALCFSPLNRAIIETSQEPMGTRVALFSVFLTSFAALGSGMSSLFFNGSISSLASLIVIASIFSFTAKKFEGEKGSILFSR